ncbi:MAG: hypothetical protein IPI21_06545 [Propionivibrio sp.]|nr:hypothetical protein [Propionivibrio sp.]
MDLTPAQKELDVVERIEDEIILDLPSALRHKSCAWLQISKRGKVKISLAVLQGLPGSATVRLILWSNLWPFNEQEITVRAHASRPRFSDKLPRCG